MESSPYSVRFPIGPLTALVRDGGSESEPRMGDSAIQGVTVERILILDDDEANLQGIGGVLRSERYSVLEASNGFQAD